MLRLHCCRFQQHCQTIKQQVAVKRVACTAVLKVADIECFVHLPIYLFIMYLCINYTVKVT